MACAGPQLFSTATTGVGYTAVVVAVALLFGYSAWRMVCCCSRKRRQENPSADDASTALPGARRRGPCDVPMHLHPAVALLGSLRAATRGGGASALRVGDAVRVACYERTGRVTVRAVELRLVVAGGAGGPAYLDPPAPAEAWSSALAGRVHAGIFRVCSTTAGGGELGLCAADDARRLLQRRDAAAPAGWTAAFPAAMLTAAAARDAPIPVRGFAGRPLRRLAAGLLLEGLGAFAAATVEVTTASAAWQARCRPWWARALTRGVATAVLLSATEYALTVIVPINVERLPRGVFVKGGAALTLILSAFALWGLIVQAAASALGSAIVVWLCALVISHVIMWPALLLLSAGVWRDAPLLADEATGPPAGTPPPPDGGAAKPSRWSGSNGGGGDVAMTAVAVLQPPPPLVAAARDNDDGNPFAGQPAQTWSAPRATQHGAW